MKPDARGYFGEFGGRFVPEVLVAALDELEAAMQARHSHDPAFWERVRRRIARFRRTPVAALPLRALPRRRLGRAAADEARRHQPHRRAQDQQYRRPSSARAKDGKAAADRGDRRRPARRRDGDGRCEVRLAGRRLHGRQRRRAPGAQRSRDAIARGAACTR